MGEPSITINYYSINAQQFYKKYHARCFEEINTNWLTFIPKQHARILDVGAGAGRDATALAQRGHDVVAVEPADGLRKLARRYSHDSIHWVNDQLPGLVKVKKLKQQFDLILLNAVWMHIAPEHRKKAIRHLADLMCSGGRLVMTLRHGGSPDKRVMYPVCAEELTRIARSNTLEVFLDLKTDDLFGRPGVWWETIVLCFQQKKRLEKSR